MKKKVTRRTFLSASGAVAMTTAAGGAIAAEPMVQERPLKLLGISCSPRKGMSTAKAVQAALDAARAVSPRLQTELIDLGGLSIAPWSPKPPEDDMAGILPKLRDPALGGLIIGSPCYFRTLSGLAKCFLERLAPLRDPKLVLADLPFGVVAVGGTRNGGHELVIQQIQAILLCFGMIPVGGHNPPSPGGTLLSANDTVDEDALGLKTAAELGRHLGAIALKLAGTAR